MISKVTREE